MPDQKQTVIVKVRADEVRVGDELWLDGPAEFVELEAVVPFDNPDGVPAGTWVRFSYDGDRYGLSGRTEPRPAAGPVLVRRPVPSGADALREALSFYAEPRNYQEWPAHELDAAEAPVLVDGGKSARAALDRLTPAVASSVEEFDGLTAEQMHGFSVEYDGKPLDPARVTMRRSWPTDPDALQDALTEADWDAVLDKLESVGALREGERHLEGAEEAIDRLADVASSGAEDGSEGPWLREGPHDRWEVSGGATLDVERGRDDGWVFIWVEPDPERRAFASLSPADVERLRNALGPASAGAEGEREALATLRAFVEAERLSPDEFGKSSAACANAVVRDVLREIDRLAAAPAPAVTDPESERAIDPIEHDCHCGAPEGEPCGIWEGEERFHDDRGKGVCPVHGVTEPIAWRGSSGEARCPAEVLTPDGPRASGPCLLPLGKPQSPAPSKETSTDV